MDGTTEEERGSRRNRSGAAPSPGWALTEQAKDCHRRPICDGGALSMILIT
ncbi:hypothetical protein HMPREF0620_1121 [Parascardovia denticolens DSM 10105 = JCM 12538]|uniref:Uncharacterized protein n=1 Tax=Parascardovia denticolens DSM 10105 = JCM 12538 TaxID=864564 RepID=E6JZW2_PARDN|nr:hypothetical protein HMPREF0620_1121 [Parascardovia denticolens DSM 10105 = JCM 12538]BAR05054.1 hypothetical protein PSDT_0535 [Parascardovia denticolens DSM 10105 = JCM 12538]